MGVVGPTASSRVVLRLVLATALFGALVLPWLVVRPAAAGQPACEGGPSWRWDVATAVVDASQAPGVGALNAMINAAGFHWSSNVDGVFDLVRIVLDADARAGASYEGALPNPVPMPVSATRVTFCFRPVAPPGTGDDPGASSEPAGTSEPPSGEAGEDAETGADPGIVAAPPISEVPASGADLAGPAPVAASMLVTAAAETADVTTVVIEIPGRVERGPEGSWHVWATGEVPEELRGLQCSVVIVASNQTSVHPGSNLAIKSDSTTVVAEDVESAPGAVTEAHGILSLGPTWVVEAQLGEDGVASFGGRAELTCEPPLPTTTTTATTTTTSTTTTTTTTAPVTTPPTTPAPTTTAPSPTTVVSSSAGVQPAPLIDVEKTAGEFFGPDGVVVFTITVSNPGPVDLVDVRVTDPVAAAVDPDSDCERTIGSLTAGESTAYTCTVTLSDTDTPFENTAIAVGADGGGNAVTDEDSVTVFPEVLAQTATTAVTATAAFRQTLPVTGVETGEIAAVGLVLVGFGFAFVGLSGLAVRAQRRRP